ncbi:MAG: hypothetical protein M3P98_03100 [bacterium]|nr:hypothetical protein [bacterium]
MEPVKVIILNSTSAVKTPAELYPSGLLRLLNGWSHIASEISMGKTIIDAEIEQPRTKEKEPEALVSPGRSDKRRKRKTLDN